MNSVEVVEIKKDIKKTIGFIAQIIGIVLLIVFSIITIFNDSMKPILFLMLSINMLILTYNNIVTIKRKYMNVIYLIVAVYTFVIFITSLNG